MKRRREPSLQANPTIERMRKAGDNLEIGDNKAGALVLTMRDAPLEQAHHKGYIADEQYWCGYRFRKHWYLAGMAAGSCAIDYAREWGQGGAYSPTETQMHHKDEYRNACQHLGSQNASFLEGVACYDRPLIQAGHYLGYGRRENALRAAKARLCTVLSALLKFWG